MSERQAALSVEAPDDENPLFKPNTDGFGSVSGLSVALESYEDPASRVAMIASRPSRKKPPQTSISGRMGPAWAMIRAPVLARKDRKIRVLRILTPGEPNVDRSASAASSQRSWRTRPTG